MILLNHINIPPHQQRLVHTQHKSASGKEYCTGRIIAQLPNGQFTVSEPSQQATMPLSVLGGVVCGKAHAQPFCVVFSYAKHTDDSGSKHVLSTQRPFSLIADSTLSVSSRVSLKNGIGKRGSAADVFVDCWLMRLCVPAFSGDAGVHRNANTGGQCHPNNFLTTSVDVLLCDACGCADVGQEAYYRTLSTPLQKTY